ncbi:MAG: PEP/pyruvate-binding domain-containing protein, partial [Bacteroidales bacterium]
MKGFPIDINHLSFVSTDFSTLMQKRIYRILIVCSNYDFYILEEDGRIEEQIFNEYNALNFRFPPVVLHADSEEKASSLLATVDIDLVIYMINPHQSVPDTWLKEIKQEYPHIPLVSLFYFSPQNTSLIERLDKDLIDHIFCWLGNADLLVAIIKLLEDNFNADHDILQVGTQAILVVEDSIPYISILLPMLYKIVVWQSQELAKEGLNEHQKMLRLRGRPKILLAKTYDEAVQLYNHYGNNLLGVITDVELESNADGLQENYSGIKLAKWLRNNDPFLPILLQSSDHTNLSYAEQLQAGFIDKQSKSLANDYKKYIATHFGFGDFVFRNPVTGKEYTRADDLYELQHIILKVPDDIFAFHAQRNDFSKWLNARALFGLGKIFRNLQLTDFSNNISAAKRFVYEAIAQYRASKSRGVIARYERQEYDEYITFSRIGYASIGGKGRGLAFADSVLKKHPALNHFENVIIGIPRTVVIATDVFDEFMELNQLYSLALSQVNNEVILEKFLQANLPEHLVIDLQNYVQQVSRPIAIRSSSKLEDSQLLPFAGIYKTYMIPHIETDKRRTLQMLCEAIKCVYASVFYA